MFDPNQASDAYLMAFRSVAQGLIGKLPYPAYEPLCSNILDGWRQFVSDAVDGYDWTFFEYMNEVHIRQLIELLLQEQSLGMYSEHAEFRKAVEEADSQIQEILIPYRNSSNQWWYDSAPTYGGKEYVETVPPELADKVRVTGDV